MKILSGTNFSYPVNRLSNSPETRRNSAITNSIELSAIPMPSNISFKSAVSNGQFLRKLSGIHDAYSNVVLLNNKEMHQANSDLDSIPKSLQKVKYLESYTSNMLPTERKVFEICKSELNKNKSLSLQQILKSKSPEAQKNLKESQLNVLEKIRKNSNNLSELNNMRVLLLVGKSASLIKNSEDEFKRASILNELVFISQCNNISQIEEKIKQLPEPLKTNEMNKLGKIVDILDNNPYYYNKDGEDIYGLIAKMQEKYTPESLNKPNELEPIIEIAETLPTAKDNVDAYILSMKDKPDTAIAKGFINESLATIEHIIPESKGGKNSASNFILVSKSRNEERGNMPYSKFIKKHPEIPRCCQQYINDITSSAERNKLNGHNWYPYVIKDTLNEELGTKLTLKDYKISPEKAFKNFLYKDKPEYSKYQDYFE